MKHIKLSIALLLTALSFFVLTSCSEDEIVTQTGESINVYPTAARISGNFTFKGGSSYNDGSILYSKSKTTVQSCGGEKVVMSSPSTNNYFSLTGLTPSTTYYYRTCIQKDGKKYYGEIRSFTTPAAPVMSAAVSNIEAFSAKCSINFSTPLEYSIKQIGVQYADVQTTKIEDGKTSSSYYTSSPVTVTLSSLSYNTRYDYRPYCYVYYSSIGVYDYIYGSKSSFTTATMPVPTAQVTTQTAYGATFNVTIPNYSTYNISACGIQWATTSSGVSSGNMTSGSRQTNTSYQVLTSGWKASTTYYYRPYYYTSNGGYVYGTISSVKTSEAPVNSIILSSSSTYPWAKYSGKGNNCLRSTNYGINSSISSSVLTINRNQSFTLGFYYQVSSESTYDKLTILVDGITVVNAVSGNSYSFISRNLSAGTHTIEMSYSKDASTQKNDDRGYIYNISINGTYISNSDIK